MDPKETLETRANIAIQARKYMEQHMATVKLQRALRYQVPNAAQIIRAEARGTRMAWRDLSK